MSVVRSAVSKGRLVPKNVCNFKNSRDTHRKLSEFVTSLKRVIFHLEILLAVAVFCSQAFSSLAEEFPSTPASGSRAGFGAIESTTLANGMKVDLH
jgi:hypothetical protein